MGKRPPIWKLIYQSMIRLLLLLAWAAAEEYTGNHLLHYSMTGLSDQVSGQPVFTIAQYLDDQLTTIYSSDTSEFHPRVPWMDKGDMKNWTHTLYEHEDWWKMVFKHNVKTAMSRFNQTGGFHVVQLMYGCELRHDNSTQFYYRYAYDGKDFIVLDTGKWVFEPGMYEAQISAQRWNSVEDGAGQRWKMILEMKCVDLLKKYIDYGRKALEKRVAPKVKISAQESNGVRVLHCWVNGFYPREVDVIWKKNEHDVVQDEESTPILPNPDGTYQKIVSIKVTLEDGSAYSCHIDHGSLEKELVVPWEHNTTWRLHLGLAAFFLLVLVFVIPCIKKLRGP